MLIGQNYKVHLNPLFSEMLLYLIQTGICHKPKTQNIKIANEMHKTRRCAEARGSSLFTVSFAAGRAAGTSCARASKESEVSLPHHRKVRF